MKTKLILFSIFTFLGSFAQTKPDCQVLFTEFELYYKFDFNEKAILIPEGRTKTVETIDKVVESCPSYNQKVYLLSEEMLLRMIKPLNFGEEKRELTNKLAAIYDKQSAHFPETQKENTLKKILSLHNNGVYENNQTITAFDKAFATDKGLFSTEALNIYTYLVLSENEINKSTSTEYIKKVDAIDANIQAKINALEVQKTELTKNHSDFKKIENEINALKTSSKNITSSLKKSKLDCSSWNGLYQEDFEKNKSDIFWLENALSRLENYRCTNKNELFDKMAMRYYELKKTAKSAYYMANIALTNKQKEKATKYFTESAELEPIPTEKAKTYYKIADLYRNTDKPQAKLFAEKAIQNNQEMVEAYILLSALYANADKSCFKNDFEQKAVFLLASQTIEKIISINSKYEKSAKKLSEGYLEKAPTKDEVKKSGMQGKTVDFGCWIKQSIVIQ